MDELRSGGSYFSQNDLRMHFGLDQAKKVDMVEIRWLSGQVDELKDLEANQLYVIQEGGKILKSGLPSRNKDAGEREIVTVAMLNRVLFSFMLLSSAAAAQTQYGTAPKTAAPARAVTGCPWLTEGSAARALGGEVSVTVKVSDAGEGSCRFSRQPGSTDSLRFLSAKPHYPPVLRRAQT